jgi:hypothetical protein
MKLASTQESVIGKNLITGNIQTDKGTMQPSTSTMATYVRERWHAQDPCQLNSDHQKTFSQKQR